MWRCTPRNAQRFKSAMIALTGGTDRYIKKYILQTQLAQKRTKKYKGEEGGLQKAYVLTYNFTFSYFTCFTTNFKS